MAGKLSEIREGLRANLSTIRGCTVSAYQLSAPPLPCLHVFPDATDGATFHLAMGNGIVRWALAVQGIVAGTDQGSQERLDAWLEPSGQESVFAALESDKTLGGIAFDLAVTGNSGYQEYVSPSTQGPVLSCIWHVEVLTTGT